MITAYPPRSEWMEQAACLDHDPELFFDQAIYVGREKSAKVSESTRQAIAICGGCPVKTQCLEAAMATPVWGVWGGRTRDERDAKAGRSGKPRTKPKPKPTKPRKPPGTARRESRTITCPDCGADMDNRAKRCTTCHYAQRIDIDHGTSGGYQMHRKRGVEMCDPCEEAMREYRRAYTRNRRLKEKEAAA